MTHHRDLAVRAGGVPEHFNYPWNLPETQRSWLRADLSVSWTDYPGGTGAIREAMAAGDLDVATVLTDGAIHAIAGGLDAAIVASYVTSPLQWGVHVAAGRNINSRTDLQHRTFGISRLGSGSHLMAMVMAEQLGWDPASLKLKIVGDLAGAEEAMANGDIDVFLWERYTTKPLVDAGKWQRIDIVETPWPPFVILASGPFLRRHGPRVSRLLAPIAREIAHGVDTTRVAFIGDRYGLKEQDVRCWAEQTSWSLLQDLDPTVTHVTRILRAAGALPARFDADRCTLESAIELQI